VTATAASCHYDQKNAEENKAVRDKKVVVKISYAKKFTTDKKTDDAGQHQQCAEST